MYLLLCFNIVSWLPLKHRQHTLRFRIRPSNNIYYIIILKQPHFNYIRHVKWYYGHVKHNLYKLLLIVQLSYLIQLMIIIYCTLLLILWQCNFNNESLISITISPNHFFHCSIDHNNSTVRVNEANLKSFTEKPDNAFHPQLQMR